MKQEPSRFDIVKKAWTDHHNYLASQSLPQVRFTTDEFIRNFFCAGPSFHYILDSPTLTFDFVSNSVRDVLGEDPAQCTLPKLIERVHPEDIPFMFACEDKVASFLKNDIAPEKMTDYKIAYSIREKTADGSYRLFLMQTLTLQTTLEGALLKVMGVHTDISHIATESNRQLSLLGLNGEPSYYFKDLMHPDKKTASAVFRPPIPALTRREAEILQLLANGLITKEIAVKLGISAETVVTHRKNMMKKSNTKNTVELTAYYIRNGYL